MKVLEVGHKYELGLLDVSPDSIGATRHILQFVKRCGPGYPGNFDPPHHGTNIQEVCRALIARFKHLQWQIPCWQNRICIWLLRYIIWLLEWRAARRHNRSIPWIGDDIEHRTTCKRCGHLECEGECLL